MQPTVTVLISFNPHSGPCLQILHHYHPSLAQVWEPRPWKACREFPGATLSVPSFALDPAPLNTNPRRLNRHLGAATYRSAAARAVHCGARSLESRLSGVSRLA